MGTVLRVLYEIILSKLLQDTHESALSEKLLLNMDSVRISLESNSQEFYSQMDTRTIYYTPVIYS